MHLALNDALESSPRGVDISEQLAQVTVYAARVQVLLSLSGLEKVYECNTVLEKVYECNTVAAMDKLVAARLDGLMPCQCRDGWL